MFRMQRISSRTTRLFVFYIIQFLIVLSSSGLLFARTIEFSGIQWHVKNRYTYPGLNIWSDSPDNVWVDELGMLHLKITNINGKWACSEVWTNESFGHGEYIFHLAGSVNDLDKNIVAGLFLY